jgi:hypothetical protein
LEGVVGEFRLFEEVGMETLDTRRISGVAVLPVRGYGVALVEERVSGRESDVGHYVNASASWMVDAVDDA